MSLFSEKSGSSVQPDLEMETEISSESFAAHTL